MTLTTFICGLCMVVSISSASVATANLVDYVRDEYAKYVEEHSEVYAFGDAATFETPDGVTIVVEGESGGDANAENH